MKTKKILILTYLMILSIPITACSKETADSSDRTYTSEAAPVVTTGPYEGESQVGSADEANTELSELTVPSYLYGDEMNQFSVVNSNENTITYQLTESQRLNTLEQIAGQIEDSINQVLQDDEFYPNITGVSYNSDYSEFDVIFSSSDLNIYETTLRMSLYIAGDRYQLYHGKSESDCLTVVNYSNDTTNELISSGDSGSLKKN